MSYLFILDIYAFTAIDSIVYGYCVRNFAE